MIYAEEAFVDVFDEVSPLLVEHWRELAKYSDIPLKVDYPRYVEANEHGAYRVYTVRALSEENTDYEVARKQIVGYAGFFVNRHWHYADYVFAIQDVLYVDPNFRSNGIGEGFLVFCDNQLKNLGVHVIMHHVKEHQNILGKVLAKHEYVKVESVWSRRFQ